MSQEANQASMRDRVAENLAILLHDELHAICPEESMSRFLPNMRCTLKDARYDRGDVVLTIERGSQLYELALKPESWRKVPNATLQSGQ